MSFSAKGLVVDQLDCQSIQRFFEEEAFEGLSDDQYTYALRE